jgi:hypothetical protein
MKSQTTSVQEKTLRFHFVEGPMKGKDFDHVFHRDGKVSWGPADSKKKTESEGALEKVGDDCFVGSYLGSNGYTLTSAINLATGKLVAFASNGDEWTKQDGTVRVID